MDHYQREIEKYHKNTIDNVAELKDEAGKYLSNVKKHADEWEEEWAQLPSESDPMEGKVKLNIGITNTIQYQLYIQLIFKT